MAIDPGVPKPQHSHPHPVEASAVRLTDPPSVASVPPSIAQLQSQLQQQRQRQQLIDQLLRSIRNNQDLTQVYRETIAKLVETLQVTRGLLLIFKYTAPHTRRHAKSIAKTKATVVAEMWSNSTQKAATHSSSETTAPFFIASDCSLCQRLLTGQPEVVGDQATEIKMRSPDPLFRIDQLPAYLLLPLESQGTVLGAIVLQQDCQRGWLTDEIEFIRLIGTQLSSAIIQTHSFQQVQAVVQERTAQLQRSLEVQAKLYEKTRQQVEQLRKLNEEREEFLSTISHELLTPLTSMTLAIRMLRQADLDDARRMKYLDILEQQCVQETHLINDMLALRKLELKTAAAQYQKLDLYQSIQDVLGAIESGWQEKELRLSLNLPAKPSLYTDRDSMHRILLELLTNAKKYSEPGSTIAITMEQQGDLSNRQTILRVCNVGAGITPEELPHIFDKFRRGQGVTKQAIQGTGLGLALVKSLVEHLDGTITATSDPLEDNSLWQTCFTIALPQVLEHCIHAIA